MQTQQTEYTIATEPDGDTRCFDSLAQARDFVEENKDKIRGQIEKLVWDHSECSENHALCEKDFQKTELVKVSEFMAARN